MPRKPIPEERLADFRKAMVEMTRARLDLFAANAPKYAEALGAFRAALEKSGFSKEESMQIVLKAMERPGGRPMFPKGRGGHWR